METCRRLWIRPRDYFDAILPGLAYFSVNRIGELTPNRSQAKAAIDLCSFSKRYFKTVSTTEIADRIRSNL